MNVAHKLQRAWLFLAYNGFVTILKKMPVSSVSAVKSNAVAGQKSAHEDRDPLRTAEKQKMDVIIRQGQARTRVLVF